MAGYVNLSGLMTKQQCPLCFSETAKPFFADGKREFFQCLECDLVFVPPEFYLSAEEEKARYDFHSHSLEDSGYRNFLNRLFQPLEKKLAPGARGLDFGCGPGPVLSLMFEEAGYTCDVYDPYYANDPTVFDRQYDFLACSETMEHMFRPGEEFERFVSLVKPGGWIGIMTQLHDEAPVPFDRWHYKDDDTHVCFFSKKSFQTLETCAATGGKTYGLRVEFHSDSVILFQANRFL